VTPGNKDNDEMASGTLRDIFQIALQIPAERVSDDLQYNSIKEWDSVGHMALVAEIESRFGIMLETDEILGMSSFAEAMAILRKHGIECDVAG
jgi:acyl carrier protein